MNIPMILIITALGTGAGALLGHFGQCTSGACPLTANPMRGAFVGGIISALFAISSAGAARTQDRESEDEVPHVNGMEQFQAEVLNSHVPVLVDFYANWCGPCRALSPTITLLHRQYAPRMKVIKVNVDRNRDVARRFDVRGIPRLLVFKNGEIIASQTGALPRDETIQWIEKALDKR